LVAKEIVSMYSIGMSKERGPTPGFLVWRLSMKWRVAVDRAVAPLGLTHAQYSVLASLFGMVGAGERPSQRRLADHTGLEPIYISKLVRALEAAGLVERTVDPVDTRAIRLTLTDTGSAVAERAIAVVRDLQEELTAPLGGTRGARTRTLVRELETLLGAPRPPSKTGESNE
jgi:MarR family transcriptional regulator, organic hydroperoxide resistance regulator